VRFVRKLGAASLLGLKRVGRMGLFLAKAFLYASTPPLKFSYLMKQIQFIGFQSMLVIFLTGTFAGMVLGLQGFYTLNRFGSTSLLGPMVALKQLKAKATQR
jgi:phospholipid/cholesterol/gamma-HCH transport system permease protein